MSIKWQFFLMGIAVGVIITGILSTTLLRQKTPALEIIQQTLNPNHSINKTSTPGNEGRINLNTATMEELSSLPSIGPSKAEAIIAFREKYGNFTNIDELLYVPGIGENSLNIIRDLIYINNEG